MLRSFLGALVGYFTMVVVVMASIGVVWLLVGGAGAFSGEGPYPSTVWMIGNVLFGAIAAFVGGIVAAKVGRSMTAVKILIAVMLILGGWLAVTAENSYSKRPKIDKPVAEMSFMEAGQHAKQPAWYNILIPMVGAVGALFGGQRALRP